MKISEALASDLDAVLSAERDAFGRNDEALLVQELLADPSAAPVLSLLAFDQRRAVGHILFTRARIDGPAHRVPAALLAPLAVVPNAQRQGIGGRLIKAGLHRLRRTGTDLVFVLGDPKYYPRHGFEPAGPHGLAAPFPIPPEHAEAWMVHGLRQGVMDTCRGTVLCADALAKPEYWRE